MVCCFARCVEHEDMWCSKVLFVLVMSFTLCLHAECLKRLNIVRCFMLLGVLCLQVRGDGGDAVSEH